MRKIQNTACLGGGTIGSSWAVQFAMKGLTVTLYDVSSEQLEKSRAQAKSHIDQLVKYDVFSSRKGDELLNSIGFTTILETAVKNADFIQESGPERLEIKRSILSEVDRYASKDALFSSSTSGLLISDIVAETDNPERCICAHPYNPPHLIPLVELTRADKTSQETVDAAIEFYKSIGKEPVLLRRECPGFIANRLQLALYREVQELVMRGVCTVEDADKALVYGPGLRWSIFGHSMIMQLGNPEGLTGMERMLGNSGNVWLRDMANWTEKPENWAEIAQPGVDEEMRNFPDYIGHTNEECKAYRDKMLIELLKLHRKL